MAKAHMTGSEAADYLRVTTRTLQRYAREGKLSRIRLSHKKVLYIRKEIEALARDNTYRIGRDSKE